jgi:hypothetical protein
VSTMEERRRAHRSPTGVQEEPRPQCAEHTGRTSAYPPPAPSPPNLLCSCTDHLTVPASRPAAAAAAGAASSENRRTAPTFARATTDARTMGWGFRKRRTADSI